MEKRIFPKTVFSQTNGLLSQMKHMKEELDEVFDAYYVEENVARIIEETIDLMGSCQTLLDIVERSKYEADMDEEIEKVIEKNRKRGYYL